MRLGSFCVILLAAAAVRAQDAVPPADSGDTISAVQKRPLRQSHRLEILPYAQMSIADPYLQRWGAGVRGMYHLREGLSLGFDLNGVSTFRTEELVIARRELHANVIESRERGSLAAIAPTRCIRAGVC